jgi:hypothetical protein
MTDDTHPVTQNPAVLPADPQITGLPARALPYSHSKRVLYGALWAAWTAALGIGGFAALFGGQVLAGLVALVLAVVAGRYDYRIWTWQARRLLLLIVF